MLDDILLNLSNTRQCSSVNIRYAYWHLLLDEEYSLLTTFSTPEDIAGLSVKKIFSSHGGACKRSTRSTIL